jgi:predicted 3-demethylubiquinone-9 3-methyltransferase (glyoxalase superfamily)
MPALAKGVEAGRVGAKRLSPQRIRGGEIMPIAAQKITPCLWFDTEAEEAAKFYVSVFKNSRIGSVNRYGKEGREVHGKPAGSVMSVEFEIEGQKFVGINGGPQFKFTEAVSFQIHCQTQGEVDYYWNRLTEGGKEVACGWLKDKFGLSWQVVPTQLFEMLSDKDAAKAEHVTKAFLKMKKFDIAALRRAFEGRK